MDRINDFEQYYLVPHGTKTRIVDHKGLEPLASSMPWKRSSQLS